MDLSGLPQFTAELVLRDESGVVVRVHLSHFRGVRNDQGWLYRSDRPSIIGTLSRVPAVPGSR